MKVNSREYFQLNLLLHTKWDNVTKYHMEMALLVLRNWQSVQKRENCDIDNDPMMTAIST